MSNSVVVGIDIGTTVVKAAAFNETGTLVTQTRRPTGFDIPRPGWAETDMEGLWQLVGVATSELVEKLGAAPGAIKGVSVSGYMGGAWLLDERLKPVRPGILWNDGRAVDYLTRWRNDGTLAEIFRVSGNAPNPGFQIPVLCWLAENERDSLERAHYNLFAKDWITYRLCGEIATEESDSSHAPGDTRQRGFSTELMTRCGLAAYEPLLPPVVSPGEIVGTVHADAARATGLAAGTPVIAGLADVSATLTGAGALEPGTACSIVGTSCLNNLVTAQPVLEPECVGLSFLVPNGCWTRTMPNQTGALAFEWFKRELAPATGGTALTDRELDEAVASVPVGSRGVMFHPYLNSTGVLAPVYEPRARARFWGLGVEHTRWDMLRGIYEGVALSMADCLQQLPPFDGTVRLVGGAARSSVWRQMFADATGRPMALVSAAEPGALGVAMQAGVAVGMWDSIAEAATVCCRADQLVEPEMKAHEEYGRLLLLYQRLRRDLVEEQELRSQLWES